MPLQVNIFRWQQFALVSLYLISPWSFPQASRRGVWFGLWEKLGRKGCTGSSGKVMRSCETLEFYSNRCIMHLALGPTQLDRILTGEFFFIQHCFICRPSDYTVSEDTGIEPTTVATMPLAVRSSDHLAKLNIEIPKTGNYFPTCQPKGHSLVGGRG